MSDAQSSPSAQADIVRLMLTAQQAEQIVPLLEQASTGHQNVLFVAAVVPFWHDGSLVWEWQLTLIPARLGHMIRKLVTGSCQGVKNGALSTS